MTEKEGKKLLVLYPEAPPYVFERSYKEAAKLMEMRRKAFPNLIPKKA